MPDAADLQPSTDNLAFESAQYAEPRAGTLSCGTCGQAITQTYFLVNGQTACERCRYDLELAQRSSGGSALARILKGTALGTLGGGVGAGLWFGIRWITGGWEFGLIAVVVGFLVGLGVRAGSEGKGGAPYQLLAAFLTYSAIVSTYVPMIFESIAEHGSAVSAEAGLEPSAAADATGAMSVEETGEPATTSSTEGAATEDGRQASADPRETEFTGQAPNLLLLVAGLALIMLVAYAAPFFAVFHDISTILLLAIIAFGVWQAWKMNRRATVEVTGPFRVGDASPAAEQPGEQPDHR